jgi:hypothetical protein
MSATVPDSEVPVLPGPTRGRALRAILDRLGRQMRERWEWYQEQQREDRVRHWWDVYNR